MFKFSIRFSQRPGLVHMNRPTFSKAKRAITSSALDYVKDQRPSKFLRYRMSDTSFAI